MQFKFSKQLPKPYFINKVSGATETEFFTDRWGHYALLKMDID